MNDQKLVLDALMAYQGMQMEVMRHELSSDVERQQAYRIYQGLEVEINKRRCEAVSASLLGVLRCEAPKRMSYARYCLEHDTIEGKVKAGATYHSAQ